MKASGHSHQEAVRTAKQAIGSQDSIQELSETFKVLGDPTRLKIVLALSKGELCVFDIAEALGVTESAVSHQLRLLKALRVVRQRKEGRLVFHSLDDEHVEDLIRVAKRHATE